MARSRVEDRGLGAQLLLSGLESRLGFMMFLLASSPQTALQRDWYEKAVEKPDTGKNLINGKSSNAGSMVPSKRNHCKVLQPC